MSDAPLGHGKCSFCGGPIVLEGDTFTTMHRPDCPTRPDRVDSLPPAWQRMGHDNSERCTRCGHNWRNMPVTPCVPRHSNAGDK